VELQAQSRQFLRHLLRCNSLDKPNPPASLRLGAIRSPLF
jgi:hypothetical protein